MTLRLQNGEHIETGYTENMENKQLFTILLYCRVDLRLYSLESTDPHHKSQIAVNGIESGNGGWAHWVIRGTSPLASERAALCCMWLGFYRSDDIRICL
jgi:hypothetical protein